MPGRLIALIIFCLTYPTGLQAQHNNETHANHQSEYADEILSEIPALTVEELQDLRAGAGMGFARVAELNHYPGPRHVLDMADVLDLSDKQVGIIQETFETMQREARRLGAMIIEAEQHLDHRFVRGHLDSDAISKPILELGMLYGKLRDVHLQAHVTTTAVLMEDQIDAYDRLRGYPSARLADAPPSDEGNRGEERVSGMQD